MDPRAATAAGQRTAVGSSRHRLSIRVRRGALVLLLASTLLLSTAGTASAAAASAAGAGAGAATTRRYPTSLDRLVRIRGGSGSSGGTPGPSFSFFSPASTVPVQPPKSGSSGSARGHEGGLAGIWGSQHYDDRPILIDPRTVDTIKARDSRVGLIRRVFAVLSCQLLVTALVTYAFFQNPQVVRFLLGPKGSWVLFASLFASLGSAIALGAKYSRVHPLNLGLLGLFTAGESVLIGLLASMHKARSVLLAAGQTGAVTLGLALFALLNRNRKYDLTAFGSALGGTLLIFVISTVLCTLFNFPLNDVLVGGLGAALFSLFLIYDLQRVVGGPERAQQLDDKDYVLGCMEIYLDITRLFLYVLRIIAASDNGGGGGGGQD